MKHIRLFEGYMNVYYEEITQIEYYSTNYIMLDKDKLDRDTEQINKIVTELNLSIKPIPPFFKRIYLSIRNGLNIYNIKEVYDDWFYVSHYKKQNPKFGKYYKCDRIDGLEKLLKDLI